jgi:hypothetical protein
MCIYKLISRAIATAALLACTSALAIEGVESAPDSYLGVTPYIIPGANTGGNRTCAEVGVAFWSDALHYQCWSAKRNYDSDLDEFDGGFEDISGNPDCAQDISVYVLDDTYVSFTAFPYGIGAAIIKGSNAANVYAYDYFLGFQPLADADLASPLNPSGDPAGLSNIGGFCWNPTPFDPPGDECWEDETAWADGDRYMQRGNWATYTPYYGEPMSVALFAGQTMDAGVVSFSAPLGDTVTITIELNEGWRFAMYPVDDDDGEPVWDNNVKVQNYASAPSGNPAPGLFMWKKIAVGDYTTIEVPADNFYGVHVDVEHLVECPE